MKDKSKRDYLLNMIKTETIPALGCTEPVAVAYAAAVARKYIDSEIEKIIIMTSKNIFKNGKSVMIPGTDEWGLDLAAVLGTIKGDPDAGLMVLKNLDEQSVSLAHHWIEEKNIEVGYIENSPNIYVEIYLISDNREVKVILKDSHDNIDSISVNGKIVYKNEGEKEASNNIDYYNTLKEMTFKEIKEVVESYTLDDIEFIKDGIEMNKKAAENGLKENSGLNLGRTLYKLQESGKLGKDEPTVARIMTAAGADMRMGGGICPIMTSGGSGNQGLGVILPIVAIAESRNIEEEKVLKAIFFGHVLNKYIKLYTGKLSAMCGCSIAAGVAAASGITWMLGGSEEEIEGAAENLLANLTGMICDGAKDTCSLKLATSAYEAIISSYLALEGIIVNKNIGIVGSTIEDTINRVGILAKEGFKETDNVILNIIN